MEFLVISGAIALSIFFINRIMTSKNLPPSNFKLLPQVEVKNE